MVRFGVDFVVVGEEQSRWRRGDFFGGCGIAKTTVSGPTFMIVIEEPSIITPDVLPNSPSVKL
jgi:hypothetical protein